LWGGDIVPGIIEVYVPLIVEVAARAPQILGENLAPLLVEIHILYDW